MTARILLLVLAAGLGLPSIATGQPPKDHDWSARLERTESLAASGRVAEAEQEYRTALRQAAGPQQRAESALALARLLASSQGESAPPRAEVTDLYAQAAREATGKLRVEAHNSYGVFLLQHGDAAQAASVLSAVKQNLEASGDFDPAARSRFLFNYGVALEKSGRGDEAARAYLEAVDLDPGFAPACEGVFRLAQGGSAPDFQRITALVERLIDAGQLDSVLKYLAESFRKYPSDPEVAVLLARYLTAARIGPDKKGHATGLEWLPAGIGQRLQLIERSYLAEDLPLLLDPVEGREFTRAWQDSQKSADAFSRLLLMLGDSFLREGRPAAALPRYALAWSSAGNLDAAVQLASLLLTQGEQVDPDGRVLDRLIAVLFEGKGDAYLHEDWPNILRFHTVLATIFERQEKWGSSGDPRSAIFQWEHALSALQRLPPTPEGQKSAPGLHARLATAYQAVGRNKEALSHFLTAAEQYVKLKRSDAAEPVLLLADKLAAGADGEQKKWLKAIQAALVHSKERKSPGSDSAITAQVQAKLAADPEIRRGDLQVSTVKGVVNVSGTLRRAGKEEEIEKLVLATEGVSRVETQIQVKAKPPR
ncbi:MAG TPA: BON domain-containing protein [Thermoanaerobaculia bacterium]|nr:BON domain-containing protein [Thermoanaerobaculia bacterium]